MRLTGAADVLEPISETLPGNYHKEPFLNKQQMVILLMETKLVWLQLTFLEIYDEGYKAKRMEVGFV